ncbi:MAG: DUF5946 family protein [Actinomycetota bacterium]|nr:DUF5946 family protein [Actinomycetota bacterium]
MCARARSLPRIRTAEPEPTTCPGCGLVRASAARITHAYIGASAACWELYGEVLTREYGAYATHANHRVSVDAYAAQHPGADGPQARRSVAMHLMRLCLVYERGMRPAAGREMAPLLLAQPPDLAWLRPPADRGAVTVAAVAAAAGPDEHLVRVDDWGRAVWGAWAGHHATVRRWLDATLAPA